MNKWSLSSQMYSYLITLLEYFPDQLYREMNVLHYDSDAP